MTTGTPTTAAPAGPGPLVAATAAPTRAAAVLGALSSTGLLGVVPLAVAIAITRVRG